MLLLLLGLQDSGLKVELVDRSSALVVEYLHRVVIITSQQILAVLKLKQEHMLNTDTLLWQHFQSFVIGQRLPLLELFDHLKL